MQDDKQVVINGGKLEMNIFLVGLFGKPLSAGVAQGKTVGEAISD